MKNLPVLYPIGSGRFNDYFELRYSLRSIEKYLSGYDKIIIVGEKPNWIKNITHIPAKDIYSLNYNKEGNIINKVMVGMQEAKIKGDFILFNDDYFLVRLLNVLDIKNWWKNDLKNYGPVPRNAYNVCQLRTRAYLEKKKLTTFNFDGHYPAILNTVKMNELFSAPFWRQSQYVFKSLYFNSVGDSSKFEFREDMKIRDGERYDLDKIKNNGIFSTDDRVIIRGIINMYLKNEFKEPSKYEKTGL